MENPSCHPECHQNDGPWNMYFLSHMASFWISMLNFRNFRGYNLLVSGELFPHLPRATVGNSYGSMKMLSVPG